LAFDQLDRYVYNLNIMLGLAAGEIGRVAVLAPGATVMADMVGSVARVVSVTLKIRFC
jgi:hypothetical protein